MQALADGLRPGCGSGAAIVLGATRAGVGDHLIGRFCGSRVGGGVPGRFCHPRVGDHFIGRFCWQLPSPASGRSQSDPGGFQIRGRRFAPHAGILLDPPQRPAQPPQGYNLLFLLFGQDVTHIAEGNRPRLGINVLDCGLSLAGFQVIIDGRFWVITEEGTLEATRHMLSDMNAQFSGMQAAFASIIDKAEQSTSDQVKIGREQTEALTALMNGLMTRTQASADQNLGTVRAQLTLVVSDLAQKVGSLSHDMMAAADNVARQAQNSANQVLDQTGEWSEATAKRLEGLLANIEARSSEFQAAGQSLLSARQFLADMVSQNASALDRMADASRQVQSYSIGLAGQSEALKGISQLQSQVTVQLRETSANLRASNDQNERMLSEYRRVFTDYRAVIDELDKSLAKILGTIQAGLGDYNQSIENNFKEIVRISNPMISEASSFIQTQIDDKGRQA